MVLELRLRELAERMHGQQKWIYQQQSNNYHGAVLTIGGTTVGKLKAIFPLGDDGNAFVETTTGVYFDVWQTIGLELSLVD
jgi:hypothetical protein